MTITTENLVKASAIIKRVTELTVGNVYKRLVTSAYSDPKLKFGIVQDVIHNGEDAVITAVEYDDAYGKVKPELQVFGTDTELKLFASTVDEFATHLAGLESTLNTELRRIKKELADAEELMEKISHLKTIQLSNTPHEVSETSIV